MRSILEAGFIFWGLFVVFALMMALYVLWMVWEERRADAGPPDRFEESTPADPREPVAPAGTDPEEQNP